MSSSSPSPSCWPESVVLIGLHNRLEWYLGCSHLGNDPLCIHQVKLTTTYGDACSYPQNTNHLSLNRCDDLSCHLNDGRIRSGRCIRIDFAVTSRTSSCFEPGRGTGLHQPISIVDASNTFLQWACDINSPAPTEITQNFHSGIIGVRNSSSIHDGNGGGVLARTLES
jgi:hypothetical protein